MSPFYSTYLHSLLYLINKGRKYGSKSIEIHEPQCLGKVE